MGTDGMKGDRGTMDHKITFYNHYQNNGYFGLEIMRQTSAGKQLGQYVYKGGCLCSQLITIIVD